MHWVLISGSWRSIDQGVKDNVQATANRILNHNQGIITGGALGVDYIATQEVIRLDPRLEKLQVIVPAKLDIYLKHYQRRAQRGVITFDQANNLADQLHHIQTTNRKALIELDHTTIDKKAYYQRNSIQVNSANELVAFHVNRSAGVQDVINKAEHKNIPIITHSYTIPV